MITVTETELSPNRPCPVCSRPMVDNVNPSLRLSLNGEVQARLCWTCVVETVLWASKRRFLDG